MNEQALRFRVGVFFLASLLLLAVLVTLFGGFPTFFKWQNHYTVLFDNAPGVGPGTPVRRSGVRIGEVQNVQLDDDTGQVRVDIVVERKHTIRKSDRPTLLHGVLGGDTAIDFVTPRPNGEPPDKSLVEPGAAITGFAQSNVQNLLNQTSDLMPIAQTAFRDASNSLQRFDRMAPQMEELVRELRRTNDEFLVASRNWAKLGERADVFLQTNQDRFVKSLDNFNDTIVRMGNVFSDDNQRNLNATLKNVRAGSENLDSVTRNTDELLKESRKTIQKVNDSVRQADEVLTNLQRATKPMAERSDTVMRNLDESTEKLNRLIQEARETLRLMQGEGTFRSLMTDPMLYNNLNDAACMLTRILPRVDRALRDVELFADKIARHPESLGLGGVVVPGSGLKK